MSGSSEATGTRYQRLRMLGRGGMGEVFLGRQLGVEGFERLVALKRIRAEYAEEPRFRELFLAEARVLAGLRHPNICQTYDLREMDGDLFMVLEYLEGMALGPVLSYYGGLDPRIVGAILVGVCAGLDHAHRAGVVHRDITPSNIFITSAGEVKILDFGVAKVVTEGTTTTGLKGKGPYMSPEQLAGEPLDGRSDLFALGAVGFEALTGECVFRRSTEYLTFEAIVHGERPARDQPSPLDPVLLRCLSVDRDERYASARDLGRAIEKALQPIGGCVSQLELSELLEEDMGTLLTQAQSLTEDARSLPVSAPAPYDETAPLVEQQPAGQVADTVPQDVRSPSVEAPTAADPAELAPDAAGGRRRWLAGVAVAVTCAALVVALLVYVGGSGDPEGGATSAADGGRAVAASVDGPSAAGAFDASVPVAAVTADGAVADGTAIVIDAAPPTPDAAAKARPKPRGRGFLSVDSRPYGKVFVDGKAVGNTPVIKHALPAGFHRVVIKASNGETKRMRVRIRRGKVTARRVTF